MSWQNAPPLTKLTSAQNGGNCGAQLWGVDARGKLYTIWQKTPGGEWTNWITNEWAPGNHPKQVYELAAVQLGDGRIKVWILDPKREIWTTEQESAGGSWMNWWHSTRSKWNNAPDTFKKLAAVHRARAEEPRAAGSMFIGVKENGWLAACFEARGSWGRFRNDWTGATGVIECTACQQKDGRMAAWILNDSRQLFFSGEETKGTGDFSGWVGPNWLNAPKLRNIAAVEGSHGAIIVGQNEDYQVVTNFQSAPGSNQWVGWSGPNWANAPRSYELTACGQNNGLAQIWAVTLRGKLTSIVQTEPNRWPDRWSHNDDDPYPDPPIKPNNK